MVLDVAGLGREAQGLLEKGRCAALGLLSRVPLNVVARVALGVQVDEQGAQAMRCADGGQVAGDRRFADAPLLVEYDVAHGASPSAKWLLDVIVHRNKSKAGR